MTLYECGNCGGITNTTWKWTGTQLCATCFRSQKLGVYTSRDDIHHEAALRLVRADGRMLEIDTLSGREIVKDTKSTAETRPVRKIRLVVEK
jgi:hypothetical protein